MAITSKGSPLLDADRWRAVLDQEGFIDVELHGVPGQPPADQAQCLVVGVRDGVTS